MKVFGNTKFKVYIYKNDHLPPHCHVRFADGSEVRVMIPLVEPMDGSTISKEVSEAIVNKLNSLTRIWDKFHPQRPKNNLSIKEKK